MNDPVNIILPPDRVHWPRGSSNSSRILACPGCVNMAAKYKPDPSGPAAIDGTHSHTLLETCVSKGCYDASAFVGSQLVDHDGVFTVDAPRAKRVQTTLDYLKKRWSDLGSQMNLYSEIFLDAGSKFDIPMWGGTSDILIEWPGGLEPLDYKDGGMSVSPKTMQLVTALTGAINKFGYRVTKLASISQPKLRSDVSTHLYRVDEFFEVQDNLVSAMRESCKPDARRSPGEHCKWCPGAKPNRCPEFRESITKAVSSLFEGVSVQQQTSIGESNVLDLFSSIEQTEQSGGIEQPEPSGNNPTPWVSSTLPFQLPEIGEDITNEQLASILDAEPVVKELFKEARELASKRAKSGQSIPGQKIVRAKTHRRYIKGALELLGKMKLKRSVFMEEKLKSPAQLTGSEEFKALSDSRKKKILELIEKPEGALTLVPSSDDREEVILDPSKIFKGVDTSGKLSDNESTVPNFF